MGEHKWMGAGQMPDVTVSGSWDDSGVGVLPVASLDPDPIRRLTFWPYGERWFLPCIKGAVLVGAGHSDGDGGWTMTLNTAGDPEVTKDLRPLARLLRWAWFNVLGFPVMYEQWEVVKSNVRGIAGWLRARR